MARLKATISPCYQEQKPIVLKQKYTHYLKGRHCYTWNLTPSSPELLLRLLDWGRCFFSLYCDLNLGARNGGYQRTMQTLSGVGCPDRAVTPFRRRNILLDEALVIGRRGALLLLLLLLFTCVHHLNTVR